MLRRLVPALILVVMLPTSCVGPMLLYYASPHWRMAPVSESEARNTWFPVAYHDVAAGERQLRRTTFGPHQELAPESLELSWPLAGTSDGTGMRAAVREIDGGQAIRLELVGDSPWTALAEYRVVDGIVTPVALGLSDERVLLLIPVFLLSLAGFWRPLVDIVERALGIPADPGDTSG